MSQNEHRARLMHRRVVLSAGTVVETFEDAALVEFCDDDGKTLALLEVPYTLLAVVSDPRPWAGSRED